MSVIHNHFYWGHGMSIGSETNGGVSKIRVSDLSLDGPDNGIRIKSNGSRGGLVHDVVYDDGLRSGFSEPDHARHRIYSGGHGGGQFPAKHARHYLA